MSHIRSKLIKTNVTVVKIYNAYILAGIGHSCCIYRREDLKLVQSYQIFDGIAIYGINIDDKSKTILMHGGNYIKTFKWDGTLTEENSKKCEDWVLTGKLIEEGNSIVTVSIHNVVTLWTKNFEKVLSATCKERCISYAATIIYNKWNDIVILSGTVFTEVLVWKPSIVESDDENEFCEVKVRLQGHKGVIFSIDYNENNGLICTTSDDRTGLIWSTKTGNLQKELEQPEPCIELKYKLKGHSARVFRCKVLDNYFLTSGEDSFIFVWDLNGKLNRKIEAHQGDTVWALEAEEEDNVIISGGGDSAITKFPLVTRHTERKIPVDHLGVPKKIGVLKSNNFVLITTTGKLCYYNLKTDSWITVLEHTDLDSYALLEVSPCLNLFALAGYHGNIYLYKEENENVSLIQSYVTESKQRIYSFHWLHCLLALICEPEGRLTLFFLNKHEWEVVSKFSLPQNREPWSTSACLLSPMHCVVGDRRGNMYLFRRGRETPVQVIRNVHNYLGITQLYYRNEELITLGRNSRIKRHRFTNESLNLISSDKLPFSWLVRYENAEDADIIVGFSGSNLIIWDYTSRRIVFQHDCGGGHRSFDFKQSSQLQFLYLKDKFVNILYNPWKNLQPTDLVPGYHIREINSIAAYQLNNENYDENTYLLLSGGEDTTFRFSIVNREGEFKVLKVLKQHLSSIRTINVLKINDEKLLVFSAGGRAQISAWELRLNHVNIGCALNDTFYEANIEVSEVRIMDVCSLIFNESIYVICACSDGNIKFYSYTSVRTLEYKQSIFYKLNCILKIHIIELENRLILISTATDGYIVFWDLTSLLTNINETEEKKTEPITSIKCHQSSINSITSYKISSDKYMILSGGDDNAFQLSLVQFNEDNNIKLLNLYQNIEAHCAHITGVFISDNYLVTVSIDQSVIYYSWCLNNEEIVCEKLESYNTSIADVQGAQYFIRENSIDVFIYGKGLELLTINL